MIRPDGESTPVVPSTGNSESATPTETQVLTERSHLEQQRRALDALARTRVRSPQSGSAPVQAHHLLMEVSALLGRTEAVLEMATVAVRELTEQRLVANKLELRRLRLEKEALATEQAGTQRVDRVLDFALAAGRRVLTDGKVWTAIGTALTILAGQFAAGQGCHLPTIAP